MGQCCDVCMGSQFAEAHTFSRVRESAVRGSHLSVGQRSVARVLGLALSVADFFVSLHLSYTEFTAFDNAAGQLYLITAAKSTERGSVSRELHYHTGILP